MQNQVLLRNLLTAAAIFLVSLLLAGIARRAIRMATQRRKTVPHILPLLTKLISWSILIVGLTVALEAVGINLTAVIAGLGIIGFTIGFALQDVSKNLISGVLLLLTEPFKVGDLIEVSGYTGNVAVIDLRATELRTMDGRVVLIPNADVFTRPITNFSRVSTRRVDFSLSVPYGCDLDAVRNATRQAVSQVPGLMLVPAAPLVAYQNFSSNAIDMITYFWIDTNQTDPILAKDAGVVATALALKSLGIDLVARQIIQVESGSPQPKQSAPSDEPV